MSPENVRHGLVPAQERLVDLLAARIAQEQSRATWLLLLAPPGASVIPLYGGRYGPPRLATGPDQDDDGPALKKIDRERTHAAYVRDIGSFTTLDLAEQLRLHVDPKFEESGMRSGRRRIEAGRKLLSELHAWPWTLAGADGKLPDHWHADRGYATRLADWHYNTTVTAFMGAFGAVRTATGAEFDLLARALSVADASYRL